MVRSKKSKNKTIKIFQRERKHEKSNKKARKLQGDIRFMLLLKKQEQQRFPIS